MLDAYFGASDTRYCTVALLKERRQLVAVASEDSGTVQARRAPRARLAQSQESGAQSCPTSPLLRLGCLGGVVGACSPLSDLHLQREGVSVVWVRG